MNVFVLGTSRSGKTPFARDVSKYLGLQHIGASAWVRSRIQQSLPADRNAAIALLTKASLAMLQENPNSCIDYMRAHNDLRVPSVIEGIRNPYDFVHLFDPRRDCAVFLEYTGDEKPDTTEFEGGLKVIDDYLAYLGKVELMEAKRVVRYTFPRLRMVEGERLNPVADELKEVGQPYPAVSLDHAIADFVCVESDRIGMLGSDHRAELFPAPFRRVHADISPLRAYVRAEYLYDMKAHQGELLPCTVFAVSSYKGNSPTFKICLEESTDAGTVFSYIPPCAIVDSSKLREPSLSLKELVYHNCPSGDICVHSFAYLSGSVNAFIKDRDTWMSGTYVFTLEWYEGNDLLHLIALENGQYAFLPHHKLKFHNGAQQFSKFQKMRSEWKV